MWSDTVREKISDLELIASWASQVNLGLVRDAIRNATYELKKELERPGLEEEMLRVGLGSMPLDEAYKLDNDPERRKRRELAEYAVRAKGYEPPSR